MGNLDKAKKKLQLLFSSNAGLGRHTASAILRESLIKMVYLIIDNVI